MLNLAFALLHGLLRYTTQQKPPEVQNASYVPGFLNLYLEKKSGGLLILFCLFNFVLPTEDIHSNLFETWMRSGGCFLVDILILLKELN